MIAFSGLARTCTCQTSDVVTVIYSEPTDYTGAYVQFDEMQLQQFDEEQPIIKRWTGCPPNSQNKRMQRVTQRPRVVRRNHCNVARPRLNLQRLKRQRSMRILTT